MQRNPIHFVMLKNVVLQRTMLKIPPPPPPRSSSQDTAEHNGNRFVPSVRNVRNLSIYHDAENITPPRCRSLEKTKTNTEEMSLHLVTHSTFTKTMRVSPQLTSVPQIGLYLEVSDRLRNRNLLCRLLRHKSALNCQPL